MGPKAPSDASDIRTPIRGHDLDASTHRGSRDVGGALVSVDDDQSGGRRKTDEAYESAARKLLDEMNAAIGKKDGETARRLLRRIERRYAKSKIAPQAVYNFAMWVERNDKKAALTIYLGLMKRYASSSYANSATYRVRSITGEYLYMYSSKTYQPGETIRVSVSSRALPKLEMQLWSVDLFDYIQQGHDPHYPYLAKMRRRKMVKRWFETPKNARWYSYSNIEVPVKKPGTYLLFVNGKYTSAGVLLLVSDWGMVVKRSPGKILAFLTHRSK
ncbi:MAG: hypothetical protein KC609_08985, partial [Myxococcales bacterium]|nr:hypothetical protein [Myxococcales bacterium]